MNKSLGQYFTTSTILQEKLYSMILLNPKVILEPSIGRGDLVSYIKNKNPLIDFDMYEIDNQIELLEDIKKEKERIFYTDFLSSKINKKYQTIVGNPPYVKKKGGNLYIEFIQKCFFLLEEGGELIFIVPSQFFKLTSSSSLLDDMIKNGSFTHVFHPHDEKMFIGASIDIIIFRYCKDYKLSKRVLYNDKLLYIINKNGLISFNETMSLDNASFQDYFNIYVGFVSGKEKVFKNKNLGNVSILNGYKHSDKYIFTEHFPTNDKNIDNYLIMYKKELLERGIRKFNETNWFQWGAVRNYKPIIRNKDKECIYILNVSRKSEIAFIDRVQFFSGNLIMLLPKTECNLNKIKDYLNSHAFKTNFTFSGRFKIGHRQISNTCLPKELL